MSCTSRSALGGEIRAWWTSWKQPSDCLKVRGYWAIHNKYPKSIRILEKINYIKEIEVESNRYIKISVTKQFIGKEGEK